MAEHIRQRSLPAGSRLQQHPDERVSRGFVGSAQVMNN